MKDVLRPWVLIPMVCIAAAVGLVLAFAPSGESARGVVESGSLQSQWVDLPDGRVVACVTAAEDQWPAAGVDCDWPGAALEGEQP